MFLGRRAQVLHAVLLRHREWFGVIDIANQAQVSPATASQVLMEMEKFEWVVSRGQGPGKERYLQQPGALLDAWVNQQARCPCGAVSCRRRARKGWWRSSPRSAQRARPGTRSLTRRQGNGAISVNHLSGALPAAGRPVRKSGSWRIGCSLRGSRREPCGHRRKIAGRIAVSRVPRTGSGWQVLCRSVRNEGRAREMARHLLRHERIGF